MAGRRKLAGLAALVALVVLGLALEIKARGRTSQAIKKLIEG